MEDTSEGGVPRPGPRGDRGARERPASATSIKALVRIARRALRGHEWSSIEFCSGADGNRVLVHRAMDRTTAARPTLRAPPPAAVAMAPGKLSRKARKTLKFRRHGCLTQLFTVKFPVYAVRRLWARWKSDVEAHRASAATCTEAETSGWDDEMMDAEPDPEPSSALPPASAPLDDAAVNWPCANQDEVVRSGLARTEIEQIINKLEQKQRTVITEANKMDTSTDSKLKEVQKRWAEYQRYARLIEAWKEEMPYIPPHYTPRRRRREPKKKHTK